MSRSVSIETQTPVYVVHSGRQESAQGGDFTAYFPASVARKRCIEPA